MGSLGLWYYRYYGIEYRVRADLNKKVNRCRVPISVSGKILFQSPRDR